MLDEIFIEKARNGDKEAFIHIFKFYKQRVFRTACIFLKDNQLAEDVVQDAFLQVYLKLGKLRDLKAFEIWLYRITVNLCHCTAKKLQKISIVDIDDKDLFNASAGEDFDVPDSVVLKKEFRQTIVEIISSLPVKYRAVLTLYYYNELGLKQIAQILNCSEAAVKSRLFYSRKVLRKLLACQGIKYEVYGGEGIYYEV